jgi:uncharacterized membrane protein YeaQ/YmgE (transglycosylase-associated protein family)
MGGQLVAEAAGFVPPLNANKSIRGGIMIAGLIWWIVIGLIAGWAAGKIMKGSGYGPVMDIALGIIGAVVGGFLLSLVGIHGSGLIGSIIVAIFGAVFLIWLSHRLKRA